MRDGWRVEIQVLTANSQEVEEPRWKMRNRKLKKKLLGHEMHRNIKAKWSTRTGCVAQNKNRQETERTANYREKD